MDEQAGKDSRPTQLLPAPTDAQESTVGSVTPMVVDGTPIQLDALGPMVVNSDGVR